MLLSIARDRRFRTVEFARARWSAVGSLGESDLPPAANVVACLTEFVRDRTEDVRVRQAAAVSLGLLGAEEAAPQLAALLVEPVPEQPVYLQEPPLPSRWFYLAADDPRLGAARGLGLLRVPAHAATLRRFLRREIAAGRTSEGALASILAEALARTGDAQVRGLLQGARAKAKATSRRHWTRRLELLDAIVSGDGPAILAVARRPRPVTVSGYAVSNDRFWTAVLVDRVSVDQLSRMALAEPEGSRWKAVVAAALQEKSGRASGKSGAGG